MKPDAGTAARRALLAKVRKLPSTPGVYLMKDRLGSVIYVGKAKALRHRVASYFQKSRARSLPPKIRALVALVFDIETLDVRNEAEALLLEGRLIKQWKPRYNTDFTDDKRFLLVRLDLSETLPRFRLARFKRDDHARYFGPFPQSAPLRKTLSQMRKRFGVLLADASPSRLPDGRWRLYNDARRELYGPAGADVSVDEYNRRVAAACDFLDGKSRRYLDTLRDEMLAASDRLDFERAASLRDTLAALQNTLRKTRRFERFDLSRLDAGRQAADALAALRTALNLPAPPASIECFDISHISGTFVVASMVRFSNGLPDKSQYRRFRIKSFVGNDDFRAMEEVVGRRYKRLRDEHRPFPALIVIDGGAGQVAAALKAFAALGMEPPPLIGLAKKFETIVLPGNRGALTLPRDNPGLRLLQRVRDEAHRFANTYNADLRSKKIRESVLDALPGIGAVRRAALLQKFGDIARLRAASAVELAQVPGIGPATAARLHAHLQ